MMWLIACSTEMADRTFLILTKWGSKWVFLKPSPFAVVESDESEDNQQEVASLAQDPTLQGPADCKGDPAATRQQTAADATRV